MNSLNDCEDAHWLATNVNVDSNIDPDAESFVTRNKWSNYRICKTDKGWEIYEWYNGSCLSVSCVTSGGDSPYLTAKSGGYTSMKFDYYGNIGWFGAQSQTRNDNITAICYWKGHPGCGVWYGFGSDIRGDNMAWRVFEISTVKYTCINSNYTIGKSPVYKANSNEILEEGDYQVYVADSDLFLKEGVKLTVSEGSVLCVKNGPFYVNGEIECYGTILVEDGGIIMPFDSTSGGSRIVMKEGGTMIIRSGGRVYAGCPKGSLGTQGDQGWLDMNAGSTIINFGLLVAGQCNFKYGQATIENHKGGRMYLGYAVSNGGRSTFMYGDLEDSSESSGSGLLGSVASVASSIDLFDLVALEKTGGTVHYGTGANKTVLKVWDGAVTMTANKASSAGKTVKLYSYDKDGKCTVYNDYDKLN